MGVLDTCKINSDGVTNNVIFSFSISKYLIYSKQSGATIACKDKTVENNISHVRTVTYQFLKKNNLFFFNIFIILTYFSNMANKTEFVTPGQRLGYAADYNQGPGTYERDGLLYASVVGQRYIDPAKDGQVRSSRELIS